MTLPSGSKALAPCLPGSFCQCSTGFIAPFLEHPGSARTMPSPSQLSRGLPAILQDQPAPAAGCLKCQRYHWLRSRCIWKLPRGIVVEGHCWECLHSADTVHAQMASSHCRGQEPCHTSLASKEQQVQACTRLSHPLTPSTQNYSLLGIDSVTSSPCCSLIHLSRTCDISRWLGLLKEV